MKTPTLKNTKIAAHPLLEGMYADGYFPDPLVDRVRQVLLELCQKLERCFPRRSGGPEEAAPARETAPADVARLLALTHAATEEINALEEAFLEQDSELETAAREVMAADFDFIVRAYGFEDLDLEEVIAPREW